jgi:hypothetical protein
MTEYLSNHFSLAEMTVTAHRSIDNDPPPEIVTVLRDTAERMEHVRDLLGQPIHINSAYRSPALNAAVGGVSNSAHMTGHAADFICPGFGTPLEVCRELQASGIMFDQVIAEGTWVHLSCAPTMRRQVLTKSAGGGYTVGLAA